MVVHHVVDERVQIQILIREGARPAVRSPTSRARLSEAGNIIIGFPVPIDRAARLDIIRYAWSALTRPNRINLR
jgi:hypothetical protein